MLFDLLVTRRDDWVVVAVIGEMDMATAPRVRQAVVQAVTEASDVGSQQDPALGEAPAPRLVVDLGAVDFIDSSGLGVVLGAVRRVRAAGGTIRIVVKEPQVRRTFELTGLDQVLGLVGSVDEAMATVTIGEPSDG